MNVFKVATKVATLSEGFLTKGALKGPLPSVLPEVISQVTRLLENTPTSVIHALEVELDSLSVWVPNLDSLVPLRWNTVESL